MITDYNAVLQQGLAFPPTEENQRFIRYTQNEKLFDGKHSLVFTRYARTAGFERLNVIANWPRRLSLLWGDMLFGQAPVIHATNQDVVDSIIHRNNFFNKAYEVSLDVSRLGVGLFKARMQDGKAVIDTVSPHIWYPIVSNEDKTEVVAHVLAWTYKENQTGGIDGGVKYFLKVEIHEKGKVTYRTYSMSSATTINQMIEEEVENTGINTFLVHPVHNITTSDNPHGVDDYEDIKPLLEELEMRLSQIGKILDKHADPSMYGDESALEYDEITGEYVIRGGGAFYPVGEHGTPPGYLTWDGKLTDSFTSIDTIMEQMYAISNTSPASFGQLKSGMAESGSALKRLLMATIMKANRLKVRFEYSLLTILSVAAQLEDNDAGELWIEWRDSLPEDETEKTQNEVARYGVGLTSLDSAIKRLDGLTGQALVDEVNRIRAENTTNGE